MKKYFCPKCKSILTRSGVYKKREWIHEFSHTTKNCKWCATQVMTMEESISHIMTLLEKVDKEKQDG